MRILVVDVNFEYKNPMYRQFYTSLLSCMDVDFFGPGYVSRECLEDGIKQYLKRNDQYDAILLGTYFAYSSGQKCTRYNAYSIHRNVIPYYHINDAYQCCEKIYEELKQVKDIVKIFVYYEDFVSLPIGDRNMCMDLISSGFYILSWPIEYMEEFSFRLIRKYFYLNNNAYNLAKDYAAFYIPMPLHGIGYNEIFIRNFSDRDYTWCIPGNKAGQYYPDRIKAYEMLEKEQKRIWKDDPFQKLAVNTIRREHIKWYEFRNKGEMVLSLIFGKNNNISSHPKMQYIAACREHYMESMRSTKFVYAEGGSGNCFVRKYFEAGACGAVLVAKRVPGMSEMGFIHEENCIIVEKYQDITEIEKKYTENQLEKIAKSGQKLIQQKHMFVHRAEALMRTIDAIKIGKYEGAFWQNGNYMIKNND